MKLVKVNPPRKHLHVLRLGALFGDIQQRGNPSRYLISRLLNGVFRHVRVSCCHTLLLVSQQFRDNCFRKADRRRHRRELADLHLNYETVASCPDVAVSGAEHGKFHVEKMRFKSKGDKSTIVFNPYITVSNIPLKAYDYVVNGRSAIEWVMERYQIKTDKDSGITNDPNDWAIEHNQPRYILDLLMSIINVSLQSLDIIAALPKPDFTEKTEKS